MKKILVVLLVLAVAGGVFAQQGEWSLSGGVEVGTRVDFDPEQGLLVGAEKAPATVTGRKYDDGFQQGTFNINYNLEGLKAYVNFTGRSSNDSNSIVGGVNYEGERYGLSAEANIWNLLQDIDVNTLWGYYNLLDGLIYLEGAYKHSTGLWTSDKTAGIIDSGDGPNKGDVDSATGKYQFDPYGNPVVVYDAWNTVPAQRKFLLGSKNTWGDGGGYGLIANVVLSSFNFGIKVPLLYDVAEKKELIEHVLKNSLVGLKFTMEVVEVAAQFYMRDYGVYFGGKAFAGPITVGLSFNGILNEKDLAGNATGLKMKFGGSVDYTAELFSAYISAFYGVENKNVTASNPTQAVGTIIGVQPGFYFNVIPEYLRFQTDVGFYFLGEKEAGTARVLDVPVVWSLHPQLFWNFLGTGAGGYGGTGMAIGYNMVSGRSRTAEADVSTLTSQLDIGFKWSF